MRAPWRWLFRELDLDGPENDGRLRLTKAAAVATLAGGLALCLGGLRLKVETAFWPGVALTIFGLSAVFGRKHLDAALQRISISFGGVANATATRTETRTVAEVTHRQIIERRDPDDGTEPSGRVPQLAGDDDA